MSEMAHQALYEHIEEIRGEAKGSRRDAVKGFAAGIVLGVLGAADALFLDTKSAIALGIASGSSFAYSILHGQEEQGSKVRADTYEAALYVIEHVSQPSQAPEAGGE